MRFICVSYSKEYNYYEKSAVASPILQNLYSLVKMPKLDEVPLEDKVLTDEVYESRLKSLQKELGELHNRLYCKKIPVIIAYEGWDAAGKGGNIKK